ncbi:hypothetical protein [Klebsiella michiganensis]|uniref:hypothetical protein n=1 Tax=Klebsiella michiganensis TaxID=1134687 RepID=UPI0012B789FB|nr:hypothetical protein [Klebsiella michiganensis]MBE0114570.1 hypothetical protein [Klebsiella michiganensis]
MQKRQPSICVGDLSEGEVYEWMKQKTLAIEQLKSARTHREFLQRELDCVDKQISELSLSAALEYSSPFKPVIHPDIDERTARDIPVLIYALKKPTGDAAQDAANAALADIYSTALADGKVVGFISDDMPGVLEARKALGQIS